MHDVIPIVLLFQINNLTPEWQYLFDQAGVTRDMLKDKGTLQFILDTVFKLGGAPQKLSLTAEEDGIIVINIILKYYVHVSSHDIVHVDNYLMH